MNEHHTTQNPGEIRTTSFVPPLRSACIHRGRIDQYRKLYGLHSLERQDNIPSLDWTQALYITWRDTAQPEDYEKARTCRLFNGIVPKRYPAAIVFAKTEHDVVAAMKVAIEKSIRVSSRAGGHSYPAWSVRDDALLLDLGEYSELALEQETGIVEVSPSVTARELDKYLVARGRAFPGGHCPDVAMGGYLLGGGLGWNTNVSTFYL